MILSHRVLRYAAPALHVVALVANAFLLGDGAVYDATASPRSSRCSRRRSPRARVRAARRCWSRATTC